MSKEPELTLTAFSRRIFALFPIVPACFSQPETRKLGVSELSCKPEAMTESAPQVQADGTQRLRHLGGNVDKLGVQGFEG